MTISPNSDIIPIVYIITENNEYILNTNKHKEGNSHNPTTKNLCGSYLLF